MHAINFVKTFDSYKYVLSQGLLSKEKFESFLLCSCSRRHIDCCGFMWEFPDSRNSFRPLWSLRLQWRLKTISFNLTEGIDPNCTSWDLLLTFVDTLSMERSRFLLPFSILILPFSPSKSLHKWLYKRSYRRFGFIFWLSFRFSVFEFNRQCIVTMLQTAERKTNAKEIFTIFILI